jgi:hypothetical protein
MIDLDKFSQDVHEKLLELDTGRDRFPEIEILAIHESVTKIYSSFKYNKDEIPKRVASAFIGILEVADILGVKNLEKEIYSRLEEIKNYQTLNSKQ